MNYVLHKNETDKEDIKYYVIKIIDTTTKKIKILCYMNQKNASNGMNAIEMVKQLYKYPLHTTFKDNYYFLCEKTNIADDKLLYENLKNKFKTIDINYLCLTFIKDLIYDTDLTKNLYSFIKKMDDKIEDEDINGLKLWYYSSEHIDFISDKTFLRIFISTCLIRTYDYYLPYIPIIKEINKRIKDNKKYKNSLLYNSDKLTKQEIHFLNMFL